MVKKQEGTWPVCSECGGFKDVERISLGFFKAPPEPRCSCPPPTLHKKQEGTWPVCSECGGFYAEQTLSLGHGKPAPEPRCGCPQPSRQNRTRAVPSSRVRPSSETTKSHDSSGLSISEQVELLTALRGSGALNEQEFVTLLRRLMAGGNS